MTILGRAIAATTALGGLVVHPVAVALAVVVLLLAFCMVAAWYSRLPTRRRRAVREFMEILLPYRKPPP